MPTGVEDRTSIEAVGVVLAAQASVFAAVCMVLSLLEDDLRGFVLAEGLLLVCLLTIRFYRREHSGPPVR